MLSFETYPDDFKDEDRISLSNIKIIPLEENNKPYKFSLSDVAFLELTRRCNLHCIHCLNNSGKEIEEEMTKDETINTIKGLCDAGVTDIRFTGGEPLLNKNIYKFIQLCTDNNISTSVGTNGTLINETIAKKLKKSGLKKCVISLDKMKKTIIIKKNLLTDALIKHIENSTMYEKIVDKDSYDYGNVTSHSENFYKKR